jgi:hypothetical protein
VVLSWEGISIWASYLQKTRSESTLFGHRWPPVWPPAISEPPVSHLATPGLCNPKVALVARRWLAGGWLAGGCAGGDRGPLRNSRWPRGGSVEAVWPSQLGLSLSPGTTLPPCSSGHTSPPRPPLNLKLFCWNAMGSKGRISKRQDEGCRIGSRKNITGGNNSESQRTQRCAP